MSHQNKGRKVFFATSATATLLATAIVPVASASFSDEKETHEFATYIDAAVDSGLIKGYVDDTFGINDNLKRSQVVIIIGRYLESLGYTSISVTSPWSDVTDIEVIKYGNIVKETGVFAGYADGTFKGGEFITRENMAVVLDRLAKVEAGTSFSEIAKDIEDVKVADLATANADYQASIQALRDLGISTADNFNPKDNVKRGQFAKFIVTSIEKINAIKKAENKSLGATKNLTITSISVNDTNLSKVTVNFSDNVGTDALDVNKYTVDGIKVFESAIFDGSKQKVTLTLKDGALTTSGTKTIKVTGINKVTDYSTTATFRENVRPVVVKAEIITYDKIRLTFSEVLKNTTIDGMDLEVLVNGVKTAQEISVTGQGTDTLVISLNAVDKLASSNTPVKVNIKSTNDLADTIGNPVAATEISNFFINFNTTGISSNGGNLGATSVLSQANVISEQTQAKNALEKALVSLDTEITNIPDVKDKKPETVADYQRLLAGAKNAQSKAITVLTDSLSSKIEYDEAITAVASAQVALMEAKKALVPMDTTPVDKAELQASLTALQELLNKEVDTTLKTPESVQRYEALKQAAREEAVKAESILKDEKTEFYTAQKWNLDFVRRFVEFSDSILIDVE